MRNGSFDILRVLPACCAGVQNGRLLFREWIQTASEESLAGVCGLTAGSGLVGFDSSVCSSSCVIFTFVSPIAYVTQELIHVQTQPPTRTKNPGKNPTVLHSQIALTRLPTPPATQTKIACPLTFLPIFRNMVILLSVMKNAFPLNAAERRLFVSAAYSSAKYLMVRTICEV